MLSSVGRSVGQSVGRSESVSFSSSLSSWSWSSMHLRIRRHLLVWLYIVSCKMPNTSNRWGDWRLVWGVGFGLDAVTTIIPVCTHRIVRQAQSSR